MPRKRGPNAQRIGTKVRELRKGKGLSQKDLEAQTGIDTVMLSRLERGKHMPTLPTLTKIADALGVSVDDLTEAPSSKGPAA